MLDSLKRLFSRPGPARDLAEIEAWATRHGHGFRRVRGQDGFVVDGRLGGHPWRIEWGPPQRDYIGGHELRLRMELGLRTEPQMLVLSRPLMEALERQTFEDFTDSVQTQIGAQAPEEMRWLVMFPKLDLPGPKALRQRIGAVAGVPAIGLAWLEGPLVQGLDDAAGHLLREDPPFVLMTLRGRIYLRMQLTHPGVPAVAAALALFETAATQASRVAGGSADRSAEPGGDTRSTAWQSFPPDDRDDPPRRL